jgi:hypothetical protein
MSLKLGNALLSMALFGAPIRYGSIVPRSIIGALRAARAGEMVVRTAGRSTEHPAGAGLLYCVLAVGLLAGPASPEGTIGEAQQTSPSAAAGFAPHDRCTLDVRDR